jgi:hypothetical protein
VEQVRVAAPTELLMIEKEFPDRDAATIVKSPVPARAATEPVAGGMLLSIGRLVLTIVVFDVQLEYV